MKSFLLLCTAVFQIALTFADSIVCPETGQAFYEHKTSCSKFYECNDGVLAEVDCIDGLHFNPVLGFCDFPENVNCRMCSDVAIECPDSGQHFYPHASDCTKFYECNYGDLAVVECIDGLHFNPGTNWCDFPENAGCEKGDGSGDSSSESDESKQVVEK